MKKKQSDLDRFFSYVHLCNNPPCVNPSHLNQITPRENTLRGAGVGAQAKGRKECSRGHPYSGDNLVRLKDGRRGCKICRQNIGRRRYLMEKALKKAVERIK